MRKSWLLTLLSSAVPGLGHLYLGFPVRGLTLMALFFAWVLGAVALTALGNFEFRIFAILMAPPAILWAYSVFDALILCGRLNERRETSHKEMASSAQEITKTATNTRLWALLLSVVPGAGHMYLGWQERGLAFMSSFFGALFVLDWLGLSLFAFALPVIWFYSFFDAFQIASTMQDGCSGDGAVKRQGDIVAWISRHQKWVGVGLIVLGCVALFDRLVLHLVASRFLDPRTVSLIKTAISSLALIAAGVRLAFGSPIREPAPVSGGRSPEENSTAGEAAPGNTPGETPPEGGTC